MITGVFFLFLGLFWFVVITFISSIASVASWGPYVPRIAQELEAHQNTWWFPLFTGYLPAVLLLAIIALVPFLFDAISRFYECCKTESEITKTVPTRYANLQFVNLFFLITVNTVTSGIGKFLENPKTLLNLLGLKVPDVTSYFMQILFIKIFFGLLWELSRPWNLFRMLCETWCCGAQRFRTDRDLRAGPFEAPPMM